ncbi:tetratricopeptide repeat protein [Luteolibacter pohnpeiensis]|uniref:Tetratricopeptide repeat protein n=1 Tax=Luteolibacter pohnpeiensis TaxID=454153 RepID=A0A934SFG1_9BACT|nr:tetratricopeptide repeat protein [Luteolibacter pohnpeiensis]MBK1884208.1 tetratricopeptide repeat protein [Luteolibacter pohnpeiensis]
MSRSLTLLLSLLATASVGSARIIPPSNLFRDPSFVKEFVGSYGFLSDVEPKVSSDEQALLIKVREMFEASRFKEAEDEIVRFIKETEAPTEKDKQPGEISPAMIFVLGNLYFQADRTDEARRAFLEAIRRFPRFRRAYTNLGFLYISKNQTDEALPMLQKSIELGENSSRVYGLLGYCHLLKKNALAAENAYRQAYLLDPNSRDWKLGLAQALMAQDKFAESADLIGTLIEENPNDKQLWLQQTNAYLAMDRKEEAAVNLEILRHKGLADESNLNLLGNLYLDQSEPQLALYAYLAAIDKAPTLNVANALKSSKILSDYGFPDKADALLAKAKAKGGDSLSDEDQREMLLVGVKIARAKGEQTRLNGLLNQLMELDPTNGEVLLEIARNDDLQSRDEADEEKHGKLVQEARTHYQLAIRSSAVAYEANLGLGQMLVRERRYPDALPYLQAALDLKKSDSLDQYVSRVRRASDRQTDRAKQKEES